MDGVQRKQLKSTECEKREVCYTLADERQFLGKDSAKQYAVHNAHDAGESDFYKQYITAASKKQPT